MKDITTPFLAILFVLYSLITLISAELNPDNTNSLLVNNQARISDVGLRFALNGWR
jgi:hypothetical protein